ncbi:hypothetical protein Goshw_029609 [Gossypium schwendimanii]|uniref:Uncharacterized protein n=1 Tax=Gossypium schwendimanii TaxID=34291 RepID=A0A7J9MQM3_GOSSC|nr:hypothetical protein [Gossypium schwendimanii]
MLSTTNNFMSFTSTSLERPGSPVLKDLARATKKVKNKSIDDRVSGDVVMENGLPKVSWWDKLVGNVEGRRSKEEACNHGAETSQQGKAFLQIWWFGHNKESCLKLQNKWKQVDSTKQTMVQASESAANTIVGVEKAPGLL